MRLRDRRPQEHLLDLHLRGIQGETSSTGRQGRVQEAVQRIEGPPIVNVPTPKWHGWKTQTGPTIADVEQSRMSPFGEQESEMPDANLREAMIRSIQET